ncbi:MAG TPA: helix-turn-helix domain-containing protein [Solirubrobacteraceae bacterium]|jgi:excisionase family DNA binding protein
MPSPANPDHPRSGRGPAKSAEPTAALFVRIPTEHARRLDRAAFELRVPKQSLVSELVDRYVNPDSLASLVALGQGWGKHEDGTPRRAVVADTCAAGDDEGPYDAAGTVGIGGGGRRRVTVETLDQGDLTVGHHSFRPRSPEVLTPEDAAELLQVDPDVVLELARAGTLPGRELGGEWRFARVALLEWLGAGGADGTADARAKG